MILVTGGTGLVGSHLLYFLTQGKTPIRAIYRTEKSKDKVRKVFSYYTDTPDTSYEKIEWIIADITDVPSMIPAFEGITEVYHAAALISFNPKDYIKMRKVNIHGTAIVVNLSIDAGVKKLCYVSSIAAVGDNKTKDFVDEDNEWNYNQDNSGYAITKYGGEMEVWRGSQEGLDVIIVNPGIILGSGFWSSGSGKLFSSVAKGFSYYTEGVTGYVDVKDVVRPMISLMGSTIKNERYILVSENLSYKEVLTSIAYALGVRPPRKKASTFLLGLFWRFEMILSKLTGKPQRLTKHGAKSLQSETRYKNDKILRDIGYEFTPISDIIPGVCEKYQAENS